MSQTLETVIALRGRVDNSVAALGDRLTLLGSQVNRISQQLIRFGKDSLEVYKNYEQNMADAEAALRTGTYRSRAGELEAVMDRLNEHAAEWARTTKFHTSDVSAAISTAAHAGWDYLDMIEGIPAAMLLAQGGAMDMEDSLGYLVKALNATGTDFQDANKLIDQWITGANLGATNAQEFGDAIVRMGNTAMFADSTEELFTMLTVLANVGTTGSTAGTMLRNGMIRLVAPTTQAQAAMELLGATSEEIEEALSDKTISKAAQELNELGFSAFDEAGNLKPMLQVFKELDQVTAGLSEQRRDQLLSAIFPMRSITGALAILEAAKEDYGGIYELIKDSEGAAKIASDIQMDTLEGRVEIFKSKWEELKRVTGERLAPKVEAGAEWLGGIIDSISTMDEAKFNGLLNVFTTIAAAGPTLLLLGGAIKLIGSLGWGGVALAAGAAAYGIIRSINEVNNKKLKDKFGNMNWDTSGVSQYISQIGSEFDAAFSEIEAFKRNVEEAAESYRLSSESLAGELLTHWITKTEFTEEDQANIYRFVDQMDSALRSAITQRTTENMSVAAWLFDEDNTDQNYVDLIDLFFSDYENSLLEAEMLGNQIRQALTAAFTDGMTEEEYDAIRKYMQQYNDAIAEAAAEAKSMDDYVEYRKMLNKAQTASLKDIQALADEAAEKRDQQIKEGEDAYLTMRFQAEYKGASEEQLSAIDQQWEAKKNEIGSWYGSIIDELWTTLIKQSDLSDSFQTLQGIARQYLKGEISADDADKLIKNTLGTSSLAQVFGGSTDSDRYQLGSILFRQLESQGGYDNVVKQIRYYDDLVKTSNDETVRNSAKNSADELRMLIAMEGLANNFQILRNMDGSLFDGRVMQSGYTRYRAGTSVGDIEYNTPLSGSQVIEADLNIEPATKEAQDYLDSNPGSWNVNVTFSGGLGGSLGGGLGGSLGGGIGRNNSMNMLYASGGRADEPSIFGEAGAEWAIPEEHSQRTADLLEAAASASGFTWPELLALNGGLNADAHHAPHTVVYSPVIYANDATGVEEKLKDDKKRFDKWWKEQEMEGDVAAYG